MWQPRQANEQPLPSSPRTLRRQPAAFRREGTGEPIVLIRVEGDLELVLHANIVAAPVLQEGHQQVPGDNVDDGEHEHQRARDAQNHRARLACFVLDARCVVLPRTSKLRGELPHEDFDFTEDAPALAAVGAYGVDANITPLLPSGSIRVSASVANLNSCDVALGTDAGGHPDTGANATGTAQIVAPKEVFMRLCVLAPVHLDVRALAPLQHGVNDPAPTSPTTPVVSVLHATARIAPTARGRLHHEQGLKGLLPERPVQRSLQSFQQSGVVLEHVLGYGIRLLQKQSDIA
mmetsp:Transcript_71600/g.207317  ORF Transcript_71600/g.207317 Transcript_71600/m.207317 type:complete len:291 (-) Transcript_71600:831-1703(-)